MQITRVRRWPGEFRFRAALSCTLCLLAFAAPLAEAVEVTSLYTTRVAYDAKASDGRERAYDAALAEVLARVSGSDLAGDPLRVAQLFPDPARYVLRFRPGADDTLWVSFDGRAIEATLRDAGQPVWGSDRPLTLIWVAVDWGQGRRQIIAAGDEDPNGGLTRSLDRASLLRERILEAAERRGLPVVFPLMDTEDRVAVSFSDIWGGFDETLIGASRRYDVNSILVGRLRSASSRENRWSYYFGGADRSWTGAPEVVVGQVADLLASELAIGGDARLATVQLRVAGVDSIDAYGNVQKILANLGLIDSFAIVEVSRDSILYRVAAHGGSERLRRALTFNGLIEQRPGAADAYDRGSPLVPSDEATLEFFYSP